MSEPLVEALIDIGGGRIGETNLVLDVLSTGRKTADITARALIEMAGKSSNPIKSKQLILIGKELNLISNVGNDLELTSLGNSFISVATWPPYERFNQKQMDLLAPEFVGHSDTHEHVLAFLSRLTRLPDGRSVYLLGSQKLEEEELVCIQVLQTLGYLYSIDGYLSISHEDLVKLSSYLGENPFRSEEDLWQILHAANLRARCAEEYVLVFERTRLKSEGRSDLCDLVKRVSEHNVNAGYDIRSFNSDGSTRYIEVKSSTNSMIQFYISIAELRFAENNRNQYWVYFVPRSHELPNIHYGPIIIFGLLELLDEGIFLDETTNHRIKASTDMNTMTDSRVTIIRSS